MAEGSRRSLRAADDEGGLVGGARRVVGLSGGTLPLALLRLSDPSLDAPDLQGAVRLHVTGEGGVFGEVADDQMSSRPSDTFLADGVGVYRRGQPVVQPEERVEGVENDTVAGRLGALSVNDV